MENFQGPSPHRPIADESEIRVVNLFPGTFGDPIACELEHVQLMSGDYEAISYVWGDSTVTKPITLDGQVYPVTTNLFTGLQYLRHRDSARRLWIDSLCINQSDIPERNREIQKMRDIYKYADKVLIWVGDYYPFSRAEVVSIFEFVEELASAYWPEEHKVVIRKRGYDEIWRKQERLCKFVKSRGWFERMWIIQEVSVRPDALYSKREESPIIHCGSLQLPSMYLREALVSWLFGKKCDSELMLPASGMISVYVLYNIWYMHHRNTTKVQEHPLLGTQIAWILAMVTGEFHSTDPRDKIFALLGLLPGPLPPTLLPDYFKSPAQVLKEFATYILDTTGLIDIIQYTSGLSKELPSWVPDWKHSSPHAMGAREKRHPGAHIKVVDNGKGLELDLLKFTDVETCGPMLTQPESTSDFFASLDNSLQLVEDIFLPRPNNSKTSMKFRKRLYELLVRFDVHQREILDFSWHSNASRNSLYRLPGHDEYLFLNPGGNVQHTYTWTTMSLMEAYYSEHLWRSVIETVKAKYLFSCTDGAIGIMAQSDVRPARGDLVCSFHGACGEFIVRPCVDGHRLIGRCERTIKCFHYDIEDIDVKTWVLGAYTLSMLKEMWQTYPMQRTTLW